MNLNRCFIAICLVLMVSLQGCTLLSRNNCRQVQYYERSCSGAPCGIFPHPCPGVKFPGFYHTDYNCLESLTKLTALRQRGIGVIVLGDRLRIILPADALFTRDLKDFCGPVEINSCHVTTLADIATILQCIPCAPIIITGHTDNVGPRSELLRRSKAMAEAVAAHLWAQGIEWDRFRVYGRADCAPIASDASVFGSTDNRRVEIRLDFSGNWLWNCRYNNGYCPDCLSKPANRR